MLEFMFDSAVPPDFIILKSTFDAAAAPFGLEPPLLRKSDFISRYLFTLIEVEIPVIGTQEAYRWDTVFYIEMGAFFLNNGRGCPTLCKYLTFPN